MECVDCGSLKNSGRRAICEGKAGIPPAKRIGYLRRWMGNGLLQAADCESESATEIAVTKQDSPTKATRGPGTELAHIFAAKGVPGCSACGDLTAKMNAWGIEGCKSRVDEIVEEIMPRAKKWAAANMTFLHRLLPDGLETMAIRNRLTAYVREAIENAGR